MVYLSFDNLHWSLYVKSWTERYFTQDENIAAVDKTKKYMGLEGIDHLISLFDRSIEKGFEKKKGINEPFPTTMIQVAKNICNIIESMLRTINTKADELNKIITCVYVYCFIWGFAGGMSSAHNAEITKTIEDLFDFNFPKADCIFDYLINPDNPKTFLNWTTKVPEFVFNKEIPFFQMLVPTIDTVKYSFLIESMLDMERPIILTGDSGVGKSALVGNLLKELKETKRINTIALNFSAQTKAK
jgi:dynein heavy chain